ncbi:MAG: L-tyrosine/L-tryptophan isonitrile synthase family protein [Candidatus Woesebacteria bacterium]
MDISFNTSVKKSDHALSAPPLKNTPVDITWVKENIPSVIIYKDFDTQDLKFTQTRILNRRVIQNFDVRILKNEVYHPNKNAFTVSQKILSILLNSNVRRGSLATIAEYLPIIQQNIQSLVDQNLPVQFVLPTLPHKKQNPITTGHTIDFVDLGEYLCLQQLKNIVSSISKVYIHGAKIILIPDGITLAHLFARNDISSVISYKEKLSRIIDELRMNNMIEIHDLEDIIVSDNRFHRIKNEIKKILEYLKNEDSDVSKGIMILKKAMLFNIPVEHSLEEHIKLMQLPFPLGLKGIEDKIEYAALEYVSILLTLRKLNLISNAYPQAIRASVHCKNTANIPLNLINDSTQIFPYNGIPVVKKLKFERNGNIRTSTTILRLFEIYKYSNATEVYIEGQKEPFYYEIDSLQA